MRILGAALGGGDFAQVWNLLLIFIPWWSWKCDVLHPLVHHMLPWNNFPFIITNLVINELDNNISLILFSCAFTHFLSIFNGLHIIYQVFHTLLTTLKADWTKLVVQSYCILHTNVASFQMPCYECNLNSTRKIYVYLTPLNCYTNVPLIGTRVALKCMLRDTAWK
jgi:hypothetical protein